MFLQVCYSRFLGLEYRHLLHVVRRPSAYFDVSTLVALHIFDIGRSRFLDFGRYIVPEVSGSEGTFSHFFVYRTVP